MKSTTYKVAEQLDKATLVDFYRQMVLLRVFEERAAEQYMLGKIRGFLHLYIGQEAVAVGAIDALDKDDYITTHYRDHGHALARGLSANAVMAELFGKATGCSKGMGGSMHLFDASLNFAGGYAIVAGHLPLSSGMGFAFNYLKDNRLVATFFGDGALNEGEAHEVLNMSALWDLPVLFICENNLYGMGIPLSESMSNTQLHKMAESYGIASAQVDGMDVLAVREAAETAVQHVRSGKGPYFLEARTYRFRGHSMADPVLYRSKDEEAEYRKLDPITQYGEWLLSSKMTTQKKLDSISEEVEKEVEESIAFAEESPFPAPEALYHNIYAQLP